MFDLSLIAHAPILSLAIGLFAVTAVAISKSGFGGAAGSLATPIMLVVFAPTQALGILLPLFIVIDLWVVWFWRHLGVRRIIIAMTVTGLFGQLTGWLLLRYGAINDDILTLFIAFLALYTGGKYFVKLAFSVQTVQAIRAEIRAYRRRLTSRALIWCSLSGFSSFVSLTGGIPAQVYLLPLNLPRQLFVATMAWYLLFLNLAKVPLYGELSFITPSTITLSLILLPAVPVGIMIGRYLNRTLSDKVFYIITHILLILLGCQILWRYLSS